MGPKPKQFVPGSFIKGFEFIEEIKPLIRDGILSNRKGMFRCKCGKTFVMSLYQGHSKLGCDDCRIKLKKPKPMIHGCAINHNKTKLYRCWQGIQNRCNCSSHKKFKYYGGRGIKCHWKTFLEFRDYFKNIFGIEDMPIDKTIDRINPDGDYAPGNIRLADWETQANNKTNSHYLIYDGRKMTLGQLSHLVGIKQGTLWGRLIKMGKTPEEAAAMGKPKQSKTGWLFGEELSVPELAYREGVTESCIFRRIQRGLYQK